MTGDSTSRGEMLAERQPVRPGVEDSGRAVFRAGNQPRRDIPHVDQRGRHVRRIRHEHRSGTIRRPRKPPRPIPGPAERVAGTTDEPGPRDQGAVRPELGGDGLLAGHLRLAIPVHALHNVRGKWRQKRGGLVLVELALAGIHIGARDKHIPADHGFERDDRAPDLPRLPGDVNDRVPLLMAGVVISMRTVAISPQKSHIQRCTAGGASGQAGHLVSTSGGILRNRATQPGRATEHKKPHRDS